MFNGDWRGEKGGKPLVTRGQSPNGSGEVITHRDKGTKGCTEIIAS